MRRISLALALLGAVAGAGCGGGSDPSSSGSSRGVPGSTFTVLVRGETPVFNPDPAVLTTVMLPAGGLVTGTGIRCGVAGGSPSFDCSEDFPWGTAASPTTVNLTATPDAGAGYGYYAFAGSCTGSGTCTVTGNSDKMVLVRFATTQAGLGAHPNLSAGAVHGPMYFAHSRGDAGALDCTACHGASLQGQGLAPSCAGCHPWPVHGLATPIAALAQDFTSGPQVTAECLKCHSARADEMLGSTHFTWLGGSFMTAQSGIGKRNVINNFCVAVSSNEARCLQCHPSYGTAPTMDANGVVTVNTGPMYKWASDPRVDKTRIDCLICHANLGTSKYVKAPATFGGPFVASSGSCFPSCTAAQICDAGTCRVPTTTEINAALKAAAGSIGTPSRSNCGFCHFNAGGGDNVKMGDLGSGLKTPSASADVHMGSSASYAPKLCADCHGSANHDIVGAGLSIPVDDEGRLTCTDCHSGLHPPHASLDPALAASLATHVDFMACQTCHIPTFSRNGFTKMNWDWRTAIDKVACQGLAGCVPFNTPGPSRGGEAPKAAYTLGAGDPQFVAAQIERGYDWKKGISIYAKDVVPDYRFLAPASGQQGTHETTSRNGLSGAGTQADPYVLADLTAPPMPITAGWKIAPFKKMSGRSPAFADASGMVVPHVFGNDSLWTTTLTGTPTVPNTFAWSEAGADAIWTRVLNYGAAVAGQLGSPVATVAAASMSRAVVVIDPDLGTTTSRVTVSTMADLPTPMPATVYLVGQESTFPSGVKTVTATGARQFTYDEAGASVSSSKYVAFYPELARADWDWAYTAMYINLNHEVAPASSALTCSSCHPSRGGTVETSRMRDLYGLQPGGCEDPEFCSKR